MFSSAASEHCEFGAMREENIRDRIVVGILDKALSRRLQLMPDLTVATTIQTVRQSEEVATQVSMQGKPVGAVQRLHTSRKRIGHHKRSQNRNNGEEMTGNVGNVENHGTDKMKIALRINSHVVSATRQDTGPKCATAADPLMRSQDSLTIPFSLAPYEMQEDQLNNVHAH